jgi:hypothetical protein
MRQGECASIMTVDHDAEGKWCWRPIGAVASVAREFGVNASTLGSWMKW